MSTKNTNHILYEKFSGLYELLFKPFFEGAIKKTMRLVEDYKPQNLVEVGVGTGYSLKHYPKGIEIVGIDISEKMVEVSRKRAAEITNKEIEILTSKDAEKIFPKESFDMVISFSVITVVPDPQLFIEELKSYCQSGGVVVIVMHQRGAGFLGLVDKFMDRLIQKLFGFTLLRRISEYNLEGLQIIEQKHISRFLFFPYNDQIVLKKL